MREFSFVMIWVLAVYGVARQLGSERDGWQIAAIAAFVAAGYEHSVANPAFLVWERYRMNAGGSQALTTYRPSTTMG